MNATTEVVQHKRFVTDTTDDLLTSIISLREDSRFLNIYEWLKSTETKAGDAYLWSSDSERALRQGRLQMVTVICNIIDESLDKMQEFRANQQKE